MEPYWPRASLFSAKLVPSFADTGATWSAWRIPTAVFSDSETRGAAFSFQVAPQLYSRGWADPVPDPLLLRKSSGAGNRTWISGSKARNFDRYTTEAVNQYYAWHDNVQASIRWNIREGKISWVLLTVGDSNSNQRMWIRSIGLWWWYINIIITILDIIHRPVIKLN
jgi:hypothetical protein